MDGSFTIPDLQPGLYTLEVNSPEGILGEKMVVDTRNGQSVTNVGLRLFRRAALKIQITDASGHPVSHALVAIGNTTNPGALRLADSRGILELTYLPTGHQTVLITAPGYAPVLTNITLSHSAIALQLIALSQGGAIQGRIRLQSGEVADDAWIDIERSDEPYRSRQVVETRSDGYFIVSNLNEGTYKVAVWRKGSLTHTNELLSISGQLVVDLGTIQLVNGVLSNEMKGHSEMHSNSLLGPSTGDPYFDQFLQSMEEWFVNERLPWLRIGFGEQVAPLPQQHSIVASRHPGPIS